MQRDFFQGKMRFSRTMVYAGAVMSLLIGAAFATGQEVMMYFVAWGGDMFLVIAIVLVILVWLSLSFAEAGARCAFKRNEEIFAFFCGKYFGKLYDYFTAIFSYACYLFMIGGVGSTLKEQFDVPGIIGIVGLSIVVILTVSLGLRRITEILGFLGTVLLIVIMLISTVTLFLHIEQLPSNFEKLCIIGPDHFGIEKSIAPNAVINSLNYTGTVIIWFFTFITMLAVQSDRKVEVKVGSTAGTILFILALFVVAFALISILPLVGTSDVPSVVMAAALWQPLAAVFAVIVVCGSFTTAVPLLWTSVSRFAEDGSAKARALSATLGVVGIVIAVCVPYKTLINYIMNIGGMFAYGVFAFVLWADIRMIMDSWRHRRA